MPEDVTDLIMQDHREVDPRRAEPGRALLFTAGCAPQLPKPDDRAPHGG